MKNFISGLFADKKSGIRPWVVISGTLTIAIFGWFFTQDIRSAADILFWDEVNYLNSGKQMFGKFNNQWGPAYALWYKFLSFFERDTLNLYYLNYRLMAILPAIAFFWLLIWSNVRAWMAFSVALLFLFAEINLPVWPKVSHYVVFAFLAGLAVMRLLPSVILKLAWMSLVALYIAYARPEFYLTYLAVLAMLALSFFMFSESRTLKYGLSAAALVLLGLGIQKIIGNPLFNFQGDRSALAFAQHFMFNYFQWNNIDQDFWITWMPYYESEFANAASLKEALKANPELFTRHLSSNISGYITTGFDRFTDVMLPGALVSISLPVRMSILTAGGMISLLVLGRKKFSETLIYNVRNNMLVLILLLFFVGPSLIASIVIFPREHYMLLHVPIVILTACLLFFSQPQKSAPSVLMNTAPAAATVLACLLLMPSLKKFDYFDLWRAENSLANLKTVEKLRAYNFEAPVRLLENEGGINLFLDENYSWVRGFMKDRPWTEYIEAEDVSIIYVTPSLVKYPSLVEDETWPEFRDHPEQYGFVKVETGTHQPYLLIKESLLRSKEL